MATKKSSKPIKDIDKFPPFLRNGLGKNIDIKKRFASIGVKNCKKETKEKIDVNGLVISNLDNLLDFSDAYMENLDFTNGGDVLKLEAIHIANSINCNKSLIMKKDLLSPHGKVLCKKGQNAIKVLHKYLPILKDSTYERNASYLDEDGTPRPIETICSAKSGSTKIVFSSRPWDIATMSERGIKSCQSWDGSYKQCLIGSIVDPYVGVIYYTDGVKTEKGERMIARSVVRRIVNDKKQQAIYIEDPYVNEDINSLGIKNYHYSYYLDMFKSFLLSKVNKGVRVFTRRDSHKSYYIPMSKAVKKVGQFNRSYIDSELCYKDDFDEDNY